MRIHRIASIPGDGIGNEVIPAGLEVLRAVRYTIQQHRGGMDGDGMEFEARGRTLIAQGWKVIMAEDQAEDGEAAEPDNPVPAMEKDAAATRWKATTRRRGRRYATSAIDAAARGAAGAASATVTVGSGVSPVKEKSLAAKSKSS